MAYYHYNEPLGLPKGSVRAILALLITVACLVAIFIKEENIIRYIIPVLSLVVGYYFGRRSLH